MNRTRPCPCCCLRRMSTARRPLFYRPKRAALIACLNGGSLHKQRGVWSPPLANVGDKAISGVTVADLGRDGMLTLSTLRESAHARLTPRGIGSPGQWRLSWPNGRLHNALGGQCDRREIQPPRTSARGPSPSGCRPIVAVTSLDAWAARDRKWWGVGRHAWLRMVAVAVAEQASKSHVHC